MRELARVLERGERSEPQAYLRVCHFAGVLARSIEHNLIIVWKGENRFSSAFVGREAAAAA
ncbi:MAG: hypothetical protein JOY66_25075 [Acetobacteraceae bacterium]|nr:hypothetical protein [Acetobacteraceae bacterium]